MRAQGKELAESAYRVLAEIETARGGDISLTALLNMVLVGIVAV